MLRVGMLGPRDRTGLELKALGFSSTLFLSWQLRKARHGSPVPVTQASHPGEVLLPLAPKSGGGRGCFTKASRRDHTSFLPSPLPILEPAGPGSLGGRGLPEDFSWHSEP